MSRKALFRIIGGLCLVAVLAGGGAYAYWADRQGLAARDQFLSQRQQLATQLKSASARGYTGADLTPVTSQLPTVDSARPPLWFGQQPAFYQSQSQRVDALEQQLKTHEAELLDQARQDSAGQLTAAQAQLDHDKQIGTPDSQLTPLAQKLTTEVAASKTANGIGELRAVAQQTAAVLGDLKTVGAKQEQENAVIQAAATQVAAQAGNNLDSIHKAGAAALAGGRNDASVAAYEAKPGRFKAIDALMAVYERLEHYAPQIGSADLNQAAFAAAAEQRYAGQIHQLLIQGMQPKQIIVSFQDQHVWAYQNGQVVMDTAATTGVRGVTAYGTDFGPMKIVHRSHPWKMHSPWPKGSPLWYPDTVVQWTAFFTWSGESFHDASWEPDSLLGPGSQYLPGVRSHGCVHVPYADAQWLYNWAVEGTPVDVYPGDGQPVAEQLAQMTTDDQGNPLNPA